MHLEKMPPRHVSEEFFDISACEKAPEPTKLHRRSHRASSGPQEPANSVEPYVSEEEVEHNRGTVKRLAELRDDQKMLQRG